MASPLGPPMSTGSLLSSHSRPTNRNSPLEATDAGNKSTKRRVSQVNRQRTEVSCDRCKLRKIRCIRPAFDRGEETCAACAQFGLQCAVTLPRKQRTYGSVDKRTAAFEELVKGLFPESDVSSLEGIVELARINGVPLAQDQDGRAGPSVSLPGNHNPDNSTPSMKIPEGRLIPAIKGGYHYVGPSSSYLFANTIRHLVTKRNAQAPSHDWASYQRQMRAAVFTSSNRTTALEARIEGHPLAAAADLSESADPFSPENAPIAAGTPAARGWADKLPRRDTADKLVRVFFARVHLNFNIFHRGTFQRRYEAIWRSGAPSPALASSAGPEPGFLCALFLVFALGAQATDQDSQTDTAAIERKYLSLVIRDGLPRLVLTATLSNVQALMLLSLYQHNAGERNTAWMLLGQAARMAIALGMQRDGENENFDPIERNTRRLVWWTLHLFEQSLCFVLGRPGSTDLYEVSASLPDDTVTDGGDLPPDYLAFAVSLSDISLRIKRFVGAISNDYDNPQALDGAADYALRLNQQLLDWTALLPLHLQSDYNFAVTKHRRVVLFLHVQLEHLRTCLGRPYLLGLTSLELDGTSSSGISPNIRTLARLSRLAAKAVVDTLQLLAEAHLLEGQVWFDFFYVHHSCLVLSLPYLSQSSLHGQRQQPASENEDSSFRWAVLNILTIAQHARLAPTYRILINVAIQFARIVGIWPEDIPTRPPSPPNLHVWGQTPSAEHHSPLPDLASWLGGSNGSVSSVAPSTQPLTLEQLLGIDNTGTNVISQNELEGYADVFNFGTGTGQGEGASGDLPFDFFNLGRWE